MSEKRPGGKSDEFVDVEPFVTKAESFERTWDQAIHRAGLKSNTEISPRGGIGRDGAYNFSTPYRNKALPPSNKR